MSEPATVTAVVAKTFEKMSEVLKAQATQFEAIAHALLAAGDEPESLAAAITALDAIHPVGGKRKQTKAAKDGAPSKYVRRALLVLPLWFTRTPRVCAAQASRPECMCVLHGLCASHACRPDVFSLHVLQTCCFARQTVT